MLWNWEQADWPKFHYSKDSILEQEREFLLSIGSACAYLKKIDQGDYDQFVVEILSQEGVESSRIEGEILDRESLQSSIKKQFGLIPSKIEESNKESRMARLLWSVYESFESPLSHETLHRWRFQLFDHHSEEIDIGKYRTHSEPMQIISGRYDRPRVFFEAPPSNQLPREMSTFIDWFNSSEFSEPIFRTYIRTSGYCSCLF